VCFGLFRKEVFSANKFLSGKGWDCMVRDGGSGTIFYVLYGRKLSWVQ